MIFSMARPKELPSYWNPYILLGYQGMKQVQHITFFVLEGYVAFQMSGQIVPHKVAMDYNTMIERFKVYRYLGWKENYHRPCHWYECEENIPFYDHDGVMCPEHKEESDAYLLENKLSS